MARISIYYSEYEDALSPMQFVIRFGKGTIDWDEKKMFFPIKAPFERLLSEDFDSEALSISITQADLISNTELPGQFGIYLPAVQTRINKMRGEKYALQYDQNEIEQFIIQMWDLEEFLSMNNYDIYDWR
jgi:hypothetical protein